MADKKPSGGYLAPCDEWERDKPSPGGDPFDDPQEVEDALERTRQSIEDQSCPETP